MIRILAIVTDAWGAYGGIAQYNRDLLEGLNADARVAEIEVLSLAPIESPGLSKVRVWHARGSRLRFVAMALKRAAQSKPTIILCAHIHFMRVARMMKGVSGRPVWLQIHGIDAWDRPKNSQVRATLAADLVTAVSRYTRRRFLSWAPMPPERLHVMPNTVQQQFSPGPRNPEFRRQYGISETAWPVLTTVARLTTSDRYKGIDRVIAAMPELLQHFPDLVYLVAGSGNDQERLAFDAERLGVASRIHFLGRIGASALPQLYREADLFVMPSTKEGFGIVFIEAMACGTRAMGLDVDGSTDALLEGKLGAFADLSDLPGTIAKCLGAPTNREQLARDTLVRFGKAAFTANIHRLTAEIERRFAEHPQHV